MYIELGYLQKEFWNNRGFTLFIEDLPFTNCCNENLHAYKKKHLRIPFKIPGFEIDRKFKQSAFDEILVNRILNLDKNK